jgi:hypothetical protein
VRENMEKKKKKGVEVEGNVKKNGRGKWRVRTAEKRMPFPRLLEERWEEVLQWLILNQLWTEEEGREITARKTFGERTALSHDDIRHALRSGVNGKE